MDKQFINAKISLKVFHFFNNSGIYKSVFFFLWPSIEDHDKIRIFPGKKIK